MRLSSIARRALSAAALTLVFTSPALALTTKPYEAAQFKAAQSAGASIAVHVTAPWCPTCTAQHATIDKLKDDPALADVTIYVIDFDSQAADWKSFNARSQSTLIGFKGSTETGRIVGQTKTAPILALLAGTTGK